MIIIDIKYATIESCVLILISNNLLLGESQFNQF